MKASFRELFCKLNSILCYCILATALTGIILGINNHFVLLPAWVIKSLIAIHQGAVLGNQFNNFYVLFLGFGVFVLGLKTAIEGKYNTLSAKFSPLISKAYWVTGLILVIPLAICVQAGMAYHLGTSLFSTSSLQTESFLQWHQGSSLSSWWNVAYTMAAGVSLILLSVLNFQDTNLINLQNQSWRFSLKQKFKKIYWAKVTNFMLIAKNKSNLKKLSILLGTIMLSGFLYYFVSKLLAAIAMSIIILIAIIFFISDQLLGNAQEQKIVDQNNKLEEEEAESITMLKAIPDSILRMSRDGICLSYMPAIDTKYFVLEGNIINQHITEFVESHVALGLVKAAQLSLKTGTTQVFRFSIPIENEDKYHEARVTAIGTTEVLILVREIVNYNQLSDISNHEDLEINPEFIELLTESDLEKTLEKTLEQIEYNQEVQKILVCLALRTSDDILQIDSDLLRQIVIKFSEAFPQQDIFQVQGNNLIILLENHTMEQISILVDDLNSNINKIFPIWSKDCIDKIESSICLLEVNRNSSDAISMINTIQITCQIAKQKVRLKTFS